jgi:formylmethanofuran dehydrogenase subunit E
MRVKFSKSRFYSDVLEERCIEFHGHGGPFMVIGLKMGLLALKRLNAFGWFDLKCKVFVNWSPPDSCVIDGIQVSTGCTMGKNNIIVVEHPGVMAEFTLKEEFLRLKLKDNVLEEIRKTLNQDDEIVKHYMDHLVSAKDSEIFYIET